MKTQFAHDWINDWNSHDVGRILSHYAQVLEFNSPKVLIFTKGEKSKFTSIDELRPYFTTAFIIRPNLRFELIEIISNKDKISIIYKGEDNSTAIETMQLDANQKIIYAEVKYN